MVRRSSRSTRTPRRFGYNADYEPYPTSAANRNSVRLPGRRLVPSTPIVIPKAPETVGQLKVFSVDLCKELNSEAHHTSKYQVEELVLRRGQPFQLAVEFDREYNTETDVIHLELLLGSRPRVSSGTRVMFMPVTEVPDHDDCGVEVLKVTGKTVTLKVHLQSDNLIGLFDLVVVTNTKEEEEYRYDVEGDLYVIFNPWCKYDGTYMEKAAWRDEYVLNDEGMYFYGNKYQIGSSPWHQGQFHEIVIECVFHLLKQSSLTYNYWKSPIHVCRTLSALINSQDDDGVLEGNWSGDYSDGVEPTDWTSSVSIFKEFMSTGKPVKYGQCWVFGSLFTTAMRAIGVPSRTITNFASAHDSDANLSLDYHFDEDGKPMEDEDEDSIWNFHVWNDAWMARPDLEEGFGGWQAIDATPQETSGGVFRMGPASLKAIKQGMVYMDYDTKFAFAEVNAETIYWQLSRRGPPTILSVDTSNVGRNISTKAVGKMEREDITSQYKYSEGSGAERASVYTASKYVKNHKKKLSSLKSDVTITVTMEDEAVIGQDIKLKVSAKNTSKEYRYVRFTITGSSVYYTGVKKQQVCSESITMRLTGGETEEKEVTVSAEDYFSALTEFGGFVFFVLGFVSQTKQAYSVQREFVLQKPKISVKVDGAQKVGEQMTIAVEFTNPLGIHLTETRFRIEGNTVDGHKLEAFRNVKPNETFTHNIRFTPRHAGSSILNILFASKEIPGVKTTLSVNVA